MLVTVLGNVWGINTPYDPEGRRIVFICLVTLVNEAELDDGSSTESENLLVETNGMRKWRSSLV